MKIKETVTAQRAFFESGGTLDYAFRREMLLRLDGGIDKYAGELIGALKADLGKSDFESYMCEIGVVKAEIKCALKGLKRWMRPKRVRTPFHQFPSGGRIYYEPFGVVLIMSPWNYPFQLTVNPLVAAIAAGNCAFIKLSRYSQATSGVIVKMLGEIFPPEYVAAATGGREANAEVLEERFDYIFFTGSTAVGKAVMAAAAKNLTPVSLELGGKSPCIVDGTFPMRTAARRIIWGKLINSGQTCVAPDYVLVKREYADALKKELVRAVEAFYGKDVLHNADYPKMISERHYSRVKALIEGAETYYYGGSLDEERKIAPAILTGVKLDDPVMAEEIFGPVLPIIEVDDAEDAARIVRSRPKPLALYLFSHDKKAQKKFMRTVSFGGGCINDTVAHLAVDGLPFGGVGDSGMGRYHGREGFRTLSHQKSVLHKGDFDMPVRYFPKKNKIGMLKKFL
ncbi:MAG: aldehyde dehydrogenase [Clostridiales bacterium]|jgi:aldehyde dehydrogenase (NAD+)|nr:aldehyde dehydrogenase [Clostridiales bacterium]